MFTRRCGGAELLLVLCGLDASLPCPRHCICYTSPSTVSCQAHNLGDVPEGIPPHSQRVFLQNNRIGRLLRQHLPPAAVTLWLYSNNISYVQPSAFRGLRHLEQLDLGNNRRLKAVAADTFQGLARLRDLHLYRCGLLSLPPGIFAELHNLRYLYLQDNELEFLEDDLFIDLLNLSHLFLHGNRLWSLHQNTFRGLGALDRLLLHQNRIQRVDRQAFHDLRQLTTLYLFNNSMTEMSAGSLALLPALEYLRLNDNPWECDCGALPLWDWLRTFRGSTSSLVCVTPPEMAGKDLKMLRKEELPTCLKGEGGKVARAPVESPNHLNRQRGRHDRHRRPHLPHGDQHNPPPPPSASPPKGANGNCTRRGRKATGDPKEVRLLHQGKDKDFGGKHNARRKNKCAPTSSVGPPSGVQRAANAAAPSFAGVFTCVALLASLLALR